jgi:glycosyltransferase involved in cell wall biosynthesis
MWSWLDLQRQIITQTGHFILSVPLSSKIEQMHVLIIHQAFAAIDEAGGTRHYEMASILAQRGHQVTIIASPVSYLTGHSRQTRPHWLQKESPQPGITILRTYTYSGLHRSFVHRIFSFLSFMVSSCITALGVREVDLVWGTSPPIFQSVTAWLVARLKGAPFLLEIRDLWPEFAIAVGVLRNPLLIRASLWLERFLYHRADRMIVNSPGFLAHVTSHGARRVDLITNGADPEMFDPAQDGAAFREQHGLNDRFVVLYAGAHGLSNDLGIVVEAARLLSKDERIRFVMVGAGKEKNELVARSRQLQLNNLLFLPPVPKSQMNQVLAAADACLAILKPLDEYKTTYPNKVFDYMAAGRPVLLAIDGVIRQVVENAGAGIFIQPGDPAALAEAVRCLANDPRSARQMGAAGRACIEQKFSRAVLTEKLVVVLEEMEKQHA